MTPAQRRALSYVVEIGRWPHKSHLRTFFALKEAGLIWGPRSDTRATEAGRALIAKLEGRA